MGSFEWNNVLACPCLLLLSLAFLFISNCVPFLILCLHKDRRCTNLSPFCSKIFPQALFLLIPCVAVDMLGHSLSNPFWWTCYHHLEDGDVVRANKYCFSNTCETFVLEWPPMETRQKQWMCTDVGFVIDKHHSLGMVHMVGEDPGSGGLERLGFIPCFCLFSSEWLWENYHESILHMKCWNNCTW